VFSFQFSVFSFQFSVGEGGTWTWIDDGEHEQLARAPLVVSVLPVLSPAEN
jgi:hypothetical protein